MSENKTYFPTLSKKSTKPLFNKRKKLTPFIAEYQSNRTLNCKTILLSQHARIGKNGGKLERVGKPYVNQQTVPCKIMAQLNYCNNRSVL